MKKLLAIGGALACAIVLVVVTMGTSKDNVCTVESKSKCASQEQICQQKCDSLIKDTKKFTACRSKCSDSACGCMKAINCECAASSKSPGS